MKKHLSVFLAALLAVGFLGGCTGNAVPAPDTGVTATPGNTPNVSPDTPNDSIFEDGNDTAGNNTRGIIDDVGRAARDIGDDLTDGHHNRSGTEPTAGADHGATTKR